MVSQQRCNLMHEKIVHCMIEHIPLVQASQDRVRAAPPPLVQDDKGDERARRKLGESVASESCGARYLNRFIIGTSVTPKIA